MAGLSIQSLKKHTALIPLFVAVGAGALGATFYTLRLATRNPDVTWFKHSNPYPWEEFRDGKQYKFYSPNIDYSKIKSPAPKYED
uniref:Putative mitochondrial NADH dehydrogenase (Ubiquinone) 1 alpha subcomplex n=1 Tax=Diaphorina citri TaxID=121845 RepID=Q0PXZ1_DIACI|nr:putative mitochondrial NADH dehydrogenase (ubiquinone) 1 alpha subcomplex [Diaphorina citri]